jgi:DNA primase
VSQNGRDEIKAQVLQATNIVELIGRTVALKKRGASFIGLCPFHQEKTPSFNVHPDKQFFKCFGCGKGGNAIDFVIERDRVEFKDALRMLAEAAGIQLPSFARSKEQASELQILRDAQSSACMFFEKMLAEPEIGQPARSYLADRGFNFESIKKFRIGLALNSWDGLIKAIGRKFAGPQLALAGLVKPRDRGDGYYDTFRNRLMFPIRDAEGKVIAFGGRVMPGSDDNAKYLNSPETPLFSKSRTVFGLDLARPRIVETRTVAVVEGYTDVVMAHQFGCSNVVSILGTSMTESHVSTLRRFADTIVLLYDPDAAGNTAVDRAVELFLTQDKVNIAVANLPDGLDPDEFLLKHGAEAFDAVIASATDALSYKWRQLLRRYKEHGDDLNGQQKAVQEYLNLIAAARANGPVDPLRWGAVLLRMGRLTGLSADELQKRFPVAKTLRQQRSTSAPVARSSQADQQVEPTETNPAVAESSKPLTARDRAERFILGYLLAEPGKWASVQKSIGPQDFAEGPRRALAEAYWSHQRDEGEPVFNEFLGNLDVPELKRLAIDALDAVSIDPEAGATLPKALAVLAIDREKARVQGVIAELKQYGDAPGGPIDPAEKLRQLQEAARSASARNRNL